MTDTIRKLRYLLTPREQRLTAGMLVLLTIGAMLEIVSVGAIPAFVALLGAPQRLYRYLPETLARVVPPHASDASLILYAATALLAISVVKNVALGLLSLVQSRYTFGLQIALSSRLLRAYLHAPYSFHLQRNTADLLRNASQDAHEVIGAILAPILTLVLEGLTIAAILLVLLAREPMISVIACGLLGTLTVTFIRLVRRHQMAHGEEMHRRKSAMIRLVHEGLGAVKITKVLGRERHFSDAFERESRAFAVAGRFRQVTSELPRLYLETAAVIGMLAVAGLLFVQRRPMQAVIPILSLFAVAVVRMVPSFNRVTGALGTLKYAHTPLATVHDDMRALAASSRAATDDVVAPMRFEHEIRFESVSFQYATAARASLAEVSLAIPRGSVVGIVGPTGSGKTTLVDLILGLLSPTSGRILVDARDIHDDLRAWQRRVGYVPQDVYLTDDTIRRNIALGIADDEIDEIALARAVDAAQLSALAESLPQGLRTVVGERGVRLSGGQRQRIGIARALYADPDVLVMDEATSSLDTETERYVMDAVERLRGNRTIVLIAHRITTVQDCDMLVLLNEGAVSSTGTYAELLDQSPRFRRLASVVAHGDAPLAGRRA